MRNKNGSGEDRDFFLSKILKVLHLVIETTEYLNMLSSNSVASIINIPTKVTDTTSSTLDHIITNENRYSLVSYVFDYDITDHNPVMVTISKQTNTRH